MAHPQDQLGQIFRVTLSDDKSFADASVDLPPSCVFVGTNGAGRSNFVNDSLTESKGLAFRRRDDIGAVRRRKSGEPEPTKGCEVA